MIPKNRPVLGKDLDEVRLKFGMLVNDACWVFGLSITKWMLIVRQAPHLPVRDTNLALLVRFLDQHPEIQVIPTYPDAKEMFDLVNAVVPYDQKRFAVLFGSESSATYRWLKPGAKITPAVERLMYYMRIILLTSEVDKREAFLDQWRQTVISEAQARGIDDIFKTGGWRKKGEKDAAPPEDDAGAEQAKSSVKQTAPRKATAKVTASAAPKKKAAPKAATV